MALVSGPTVGNAISDPENVVGQLVNKVKDNKDLVNRLFMRFLSRPGKDNEVEAATEMFNDVESDHAKLVADLTAYETDLAPKIAKREIERQNRIVGLQAELDAYRELVKLRQPRAEQARQARIAKAQAAVAKRDKRLMAKLPEWEASQKVTTQWQPVAPIELSASYNARLTLQPDGSVFVDGDNGKGVYRITTPSSLEKITGVRLEALADERLPNRGPGRGNGNFVVTEFVARAMPMGGSQKLIKSWDFAGDDEWQVEDGAKVVADSGMRHLFGSGQPVGIKTSLKLPAGVYLLDVTSGIRSAVSFTVQWTTDKAPAFDTARSAKRSMSAGNGGGLSSLIPIQVDGELTGLRILVNGGQSVLPIDSIRLFAAEGGITDLKLQNAKGTFSQGGYDVTTAIDGNSAAEAGNGWAISPQLGRDHAATFELAAPFEAASGRTLEFAIHQNFQDNQHTLGKFRISVTSSPLPLGFGLPAAIQGILAKPAAERTDADREALLVEVRKTDKRNQELQAQLAEAQKPLAEDPQLKKLEADLAAAQQPSPIDSKLQQLRRAVALSEDQLKNKRLTVAQDIVWALINNSAFLYNH
jgi:hypothetical protein